jgi:Cys-rich protein (TIGR01571 family)
MSSPARITRADDIETEEDQDDRHLPPPMLPPTVDVIAPSSLDGGYIFDAVHNGQVFPVAVPEGGVKAGETFTVPFQPHYNAEGDENDDNMIIVEATEVTPMFVPSSNSQQQQQQQRSQQQYAGKWKDGLCDCCVEGCCHPSLLNAICFKQILIGQTLTRMKLTWCGVPASSRNEYKSTFHVLLWLTICYWIIWFFFHDCDEESHNNGGHFCHGPARHVMSTVNCVWWVYTIIILIKLRKAVRTRYNIRERQCTGCEDCCCAVFCTCCTVAQLARQTANYQSQRAYCCTETGLANEEYYTIEEAIIV